MTQRRLTALYFTKGLRLFAYGSASIALPVHLSALHVAPVWIGAILAASLCAGAAQMFLTNRLARAFGSRPVAIIVSLAMALGGVVTAGGIPVLLIAAAALGLLNAGDKDVGPFLPLEHVALASEEGAVHRLALYNAIGTGALALGAACGGMLPYTVAFLLYAFCGVCLAILYTIAPLPTPSEGTRDALPAKRFGVSERLAALFAVDAFAGGLVVQGFLAYWFIARFHAPGQTVGFLLGAANVVAALSLFAAAWLSKRFGNLNTMVFTHLPSNVLLAAIPFAPTFTVAAALLLLRYLLSQMDVPTRQAFVVAIVPERERIHAAGVTSAVRPVAAAASPLLASLAMQVASAGIPFFAAGAIKACYDLAVYFAFRNARSPEAAAERA